MSLRRRAVLSTAALAMPALCACASASAGPAPAMPGEMARCKVAAGHENPLVTEWPGADKAELQARSQSGAVLVQYSGCNLRVVRACGAAGSYRWRRTTTSTDFVEVRNADELFAKLPLAAATLEPQLERSGSLSVQTTVSGQLELEGFDAERAERAPGCQAATHVVRSVAVGAYRMSAGDSRARAVGDPAACKLSTEDRPHADCGSPVQLFLAPLPRTTARMGPAGTLRVRFLPPDTDHEWKLASGKRELCALPCERRVDVGMPYAYRAEGGFLRPDYEQELPDLRPHAEAGEVEVRPTPRKSGRLAGGIVMTSLGGVAMLTGTALLAASCGESTGGCVAGAITLPLGALAVAGGVWLIVTSGSTIEVAPAALPIGINLDGEPVR